MKKTLAITVLFLALCLSASAATYQVDGRQVDELTLAKKLEARFQELLLQYRQSIGLSMLTKNSVLADGSMSHVTNLMRFNIESIVANPSTREKHAHENYEARYAQMAQILKNQHYRTKRGGEIVCWGYYMLKDSQGNIDISASAKDILARFLNSPYHKAIIETPYESGSFYGTALVISGNRMILVCNFIGIKG